MSLAPLPGFGAPLAAMTSRDFVARASERESFDDSVAAVAADADSEDPMTASAVAGSSGAGAPARSRDESSSGARSLDPLANGIADASSANGSARLSAGVNSVESSGSAIATEHGAKASTQSNPPSDANGRGPASGKSTSNARVEPHSASPAFHFLGAASVAQGATASAEQSVTASSARGETASDEQGVTSTDTPGEAANGAQSGTSAGTQGSTANGVRGVTAVVEGGTTTTGKQPNAERSATEAPPPASSSSALATSVEEISRPAPESSASSPGTEGSTRGDATEGSRASDVPIHVRTAPLNATTARSNVTAATSLVPLEALPEEITRMVRFAVGTSGREAVLRLDPPELGAVRIEIRIQGNDVMVRITAEREDVRHWLEVGREGLGDRFERSGLRLERLAIETARSDDASLLNQRGAPDGGRRESFLEQRNFAEGQRHGERSFEPKQPSPLRSRDGESRMERVPVLESEVRLDRWA